MKLLSMAALGAVLAAATPALAQELTPRQESLRAVYEELVEIDTSPTTGSCTRGAEAIATRLRAAGFAESDVAVIVPEGKPDDGNVTAVIRGTNARLPAVLLLAHIDVVDARREDWTRDPFTLVEEDGFFFGRGTADDKAMAAVFTDLFVRLRAENFRPRRDLKLALTCGEETSNRVNGVDYLLRHHRALVQAGMAINEGAGGTLGADGAAIALQVQAGEKIHQVFTLNVENPGGHSSRPRSDNAIYQLSTALGRVSAHSFPIEIGEATRAHFTAMAPIVGGDTGAAMAAVGRNPNDAEAVAVLARDPSYNAMMRTTCVATQLDAGHAANALPQRAQATLSCRVLQGHTPEEVKAALESAIADPGVRVDIVRRREGSNPPPLTRAVMGPIERAAARIWPGAAIVPTMAAGATDGRFLNNAGIATYGASGMFSLPGETNAHGLNEKLRVKSLYDGQDFLEEIVRAYSMQR